MHHIIDPLTNAPADTPLRTVSVAAENCTDANIAATAAIVRGEHALQWLRGLGLPARLVARGGEVSTVGSWPADLSQAAPLSQTAPSSQQRSARPGRRQLAGAAGHTLGSAA
jgi:hypothetical protein